MVALNDFMIPDTYAPVGLRSFTAVGPLRCVVFKRFCVVALQVGYRVRRPVSSLRWCVEWCRKVSKPSKTPARTYLPFLLLYRDWILLVQGGESSSVLSVGKKKATR